MPDSTIKIESEIIRWVERNLSCRVKNISPIQGGNNNRVYRVETEGKSYCLKQFFTHEDDPRDRLKHEFRFLEFCKTQNVSHVPLLIASDKKLSIILMTWVEGRTANEDDVTPKNMMKIGEILEKMNTKGLKEGVLPTASEACFSLIKHLKSVDRRVIALEDIDGRDEIAQEAVDFVVDELEPCYEKLRERFLAECAEVGLDINLEIKWDVRVASPSDFGFHNVIVGGDDELHLVDFEYAGVDDAAKLICDFLLQVKLPVPADAKGILLDVFEDLGWDRLSLNERVRVLLPLYRMKWVCMMLNEFLPVSGERREFSNQEKKKVDTRGRQIDKARTMLKSLVANF